MNLELILKDIDREIANINADFERVTRSLPDCAYRAGLLEGIDRTRSHLMYVRAYVEGVMEAAGQSDE